MGFSEVLSHVYQKKCDKRIILIRHSEKEKTPEGDIYYDVGLTENGFITASEFGKSLFSTVDPIDCKILTSPLKRCVQTAESISKNTCAIEKSNILGGPGPYIEDEKTAGATFRNLVAEKDGVNIISLQMEGQELPGFRDISEGSKILLDYLFKACTKHICIGVTHDVIIAALIGYISGKIEDVEEWIKYLDGIVFCVKGGRVFLYTKEIAGREITEKIKMIVNEGI